MDMARLRPTQAIGIALLAMNQRDKAVLEFLLQRYLPGDFVEAPSTEAKLAIIDGDSAEGHTAVQEWQNTKAGRMTFVLSLHDLAPSAAIRAIRKPIDVKSLVAQLRELHSQWNDPAAVSARKNSSPDARPKRGEKATNRTVRATAKNSVLMPSSPSSPGSAHNEAGNQPTPDAPVRMKSLETSGAVQADSDASTQVMAPSPHAASAIETVRRDAPAEALQGATSRSTQTRDAAPERKSIPPTVSAEPAEDLQEPSAPREATATETDLHLQKPAPPKGPDAAERKRPTTALGAERVHDVCGSLPDIAAERLLPADEIPADLAQQRFFDADTSLLGLLRRAKQMALAQNKAVEIYGEFSLAVVVPGTPARVVCRLKNSLLHSLCGSPALMQALGLRLLDTVPNEALESYDSFAWRVALWTARGRLPRGCDPRVASRLNSWPNFPRLDEIPHAMRLAAVWTQRCLSPAAAAALLSIPQRYAFAFYVATAELGLMEHQQGDNPEPSAPAAAATLSSDPRRGLLKRLLSRLINVT